jgi:hypothetical protein
MVEHALDLHDSAAAAADSDKHTLMAVTYAVATLKCDGVWEQLESGRAIGLGIRALEYLGAPPPLLHARRRAGRGCMPVTVPALHCMSVMVPALRCMSVTVPLASRLVQYASAPPAPNSGDMPPPNCRH